MGKAIAYGLSLGENGWGEHFSFMEWKGDKRRVVFPDRFHASGWSRLLGKVSQLLGKLKAPGTKGRLLAVTNQMEGKSETSMCRMNCLRCRVDIFAKVELDI